MILPVICVKSFTWLWV